MNFSTINESSLHNTIKNFYAIQTNGKTEHKLHNHVYDVFTEKEEVIEIQTANLAKILPKVLDTLEKDIPTKVVFPLVTKKRIITKTEDGKIKSKRTSPKRGSIFDIFIELTGFYPALLHKNFTLEILFVEISEERTKTETPVQSKNKQRRYKKDWNKTNKHLEKIEKSIILKTKDDYLKLLPQNLEKEFCAKDINKLLKADKNIPKNYHPNGNLIIWVFNKMEIIEQTKVENRNRYYKIKK